ncbi:MAG: acetolactate synthase small subunit [Clostridia bacterium]|nr:acetolactate synthase small subunit [Clostridia bacterium]
MKESFVISALVTNHAGVLTRVSSLFARRGFNIDSLTVGVTEDPKFSRVTVSATCDEATKEQIVKQFSKLHDVKKICVMEKGNSVMREMMLVKIAVPRDSIANIMTSVDIFRGKIVDLGVESITVQLTGESSKIDAFIDFLRQYEILELTRTGLTAIGRGKECLKNRD